VNIKEYISGGIVESYVLGLASEQERSEFEQLCLQYPELVAARNEFEEALEKQAFELAIAPSASVKERVLNVIREIEPPAKEAKVITMERRPRISSWPRYVAAASIILLLVSAYFAYDFYSDNKQLQGSANQLQSKFDSLTFQLTEKQKMIDMITRPSVTVVSMVGTQPNPSSASIYWDTASTDVFMVIKNIPKLPSEKQYQLWAFIKGQPVDLGLFDALEDKVILKMKNTQKAEAFAITIEKRGNGPVPHGTVETQGKTNL
jgi:anti-sigma-K factor RskA